MKSLNCILYLWRNEGQLYTLCHSVISLGSNVPGTNLGQQCSRMTHIKASVTGIALPVDTLSNSNYCVSFHPIRASGSNHIKKHLQKTHNVSEDHEDIHAYTIKESFSNTPQPSSSTAT